MGVQAKLSWISVTDHDTIGGIAEGRAEAERLGIGFLTGVELSVEFSGQDFHVLGYDFDPEDADLKQLLAEGVVSRRIRAEKIISRLHGLGIDLPLERVRERVGVSGLVGRPHVAEALISAGWVQTFPEAFARFLGKDAPAYVAKTPILPSRALGILRKAGAVPVLAHPGAYNLDGTLQAFLKEGLQGLETMHPKHTVEAVAGFRRLAARYNLVATGGSDFHGRGTMEVPIGGIRVDAGVVDEILARKETHE
jgi:3',5'-nucleoside bisphosphate phosphatase